MLVARQTVVDSRKCMEIDQKHKESVGHGLLICHSQLMRGFR